MDLIYRLLELATSIAAILATIKIKMHILKETPVLNLLDAFLSLFQYIHLNNFMWPCSYLKQILNTVN